MLKKGEQYKSAITRQGQRCMQKQNCEMRTGKTVRESEGGQGVLDAAVGNIMMCVAPVFRSPNWRIGDLLGTFLGRGSLESLGSLGRSLGPSLSDQKDAQDGKSDRA